MESASAQRIEPEPKRRIDSNVIPLRADAPDKSERMGCEMHMASRYEAPIQKLSVVLPRRSAVMFYCLWIRAPGNYKDIILTDTAIITLVASTATKKEKMRRQPSKINDLLSIIERRLRRVRRRTNSKSTSVSNRYYIANNTGWGYANVYRVYCDASSP